MLKITKTFTIKYDRDMPIKISRWFSRFLAAFPGTEGFDAIKGLNLPHIHRFVSNEQNAIPTDPDIDLMLECASLERAGLTFHSRRIDYQDVYD